MRPQQTVVILDWDDTLLPTTDLNRFTTNYHFDKTNIPTNYIEALSRLEDLVIQVLIKTF